MKNINSNQIDLVTTRLGRFSRAARIRCAVAFLAAFGLTSPLQAQWNQAGAGPYDYNTAANWGGSINGVWPNTLSLSAAQTVTFGADTVLNTGLTFYYAATAGNYAVTIQSTNSATHWVTLGGDIVMSPSSGAPLMTIGSSGNPLHLNLGGTRNISLTNLNTANGLVIKSTMTNGALVKWGPSPVTFQGVGSTLTSLTVSNGQWQCRSYGLTQSNVVNSTGNTTAGGQLYLDCTGGALFTNPITLLGPGNANLNGTIPLEFNPNGSFTNFVTNTAPITLIGSSTYIIQIADNHYHPAATPRAPELLVNGGITRSGGTGTLILYPTGSYQEVGIENSNACTLLVNSPINNNGGPLTLEGANVSQVIIATNGNNIGDTTVTFYGSSVNPTNNFFAIMGIANALNTNGNLNVNIGTFDLAGYNQTVNGLGGLAGTGTITNSGAACTLTVGNNGGGTNCAAALVDSGGGQLALTKVGAGTQSLSGTNTYSGPTTISSGKLVGVTGGSCSNSAVTVQAASGTATLAVNYTGADAQWTCGGLTTAAGGSGSILEFDFTNGASTATAPLYVINNVNFTATPTVTVALSNNISLSANTSYPLLTVGGLAPSAVPTLNLIASASRTSYPGANLTWGGTGNKTLILNIMTGATSTEPLHWVGSSGSGTWDVSNSGNAIWKDSASPANTTYYVDGDQVSFDDNNISANQTVTLNTTANPSSVTVNDSNYNYTITGSGSIAGSASLSKSGAGTLSLSTSNNYSGGTTVGGGTLSLGNGKALGSGSLTLSGGNLDSSVANLVISNNVQNWNSDFTFVGSQNLNLGTGSVTLNATRQVTVSANALTVGGVIGGSGFGLTKSGSGTLVVAGANTYTGSTTVSNGTLQVGVANAVPTNSALVVQGGNLTLAGGWDTVSTLSGSGGTINITTNKLTVTGVAGQTNVYSGNITGYFATSAGSFQNSFFGVVLNNGTQIFTNGIITLTADNGTYSSARLCQISPASGAWMDFSGTTLLTNVNISPNGSTVRFNGGTHVLDPGGYTAGGGVINLSTSTAGNTETVIVDGGAAVTVAQLNLGFSGTGTNILTINSGSMTLSGQNGVNLGWAGVGSAATINLNGGVLKTGIIGLPGSSTNTINFNGGTFVCNNTNVIPGVTNLGGNLIKLLVGNGGAVIDTTNKNNTISLVLQNNGSGGLTKLGTATLTLTANNTYVGSTVVSNGVLLVNGSTASASAFTVANGAAIGGSGTIGGDVTLNTGASATNSQGTPLTISGSLTLNNNAMNVSTPSALGAGDYTLITYNATGSSGAFNSTPILSGAGLAANTTGTIVTGSGTVKLHVALNTLPTTVALTSSTNASTYGQSVIFTALVQTNSMTAGLTSGNVVFAVDGTPVATNGLASGQATYTTSLLAVPSHLIQAIYSGDVNYLPSTNTFIQTVNPAPLGITANNTNKVYDGVVFIGGNGVMYSGFVNGETSSVLTGTLAYGGTSQGATNAGSYSLIPFGVNNANYAINFTNGTLTINQASTSVGAVSTNNPCGYKDAVAFLATLPGDATGSVVFSSTNWPISTNSVSSGGTTSLSITNLPRGTNVITVAYLGDGNYFGSSTNLEQIVTNHPPMLASLNLTRTAGLSLRFPWSQLTNQWSDADGDVVTLTTFNLSTTNNVSLFTNATLIGYPSTAPNVADQINYTASDSYGDAVTGVINIAVNAYVTDTNSIVNITTGNPTTLKAYGVIGFSYITERSTNLTDWASIATNTVSTNGVIYVSDSFSDLGGNTPSSAYYRIKWQP